MTNLKASAGSRALHAEPNVIPFIDVLLVLLIIFMVTAPQPTVDLQLHLPGPNPRHVELQTIIVDVSDGAGRATVFVDGIETSWEDLPNAVLLAGLSDDSTLDADAFFDEAHVLVRADQDVAYAHVVSAIDDLQSAGFAKVGLVAQAVDDA